MFLIYIYISNTILTEITFFNCYGVTTQLTILQIVHLYSCNNFTLEMVPIATEEYW
jgi:hypothetical protein